MRHESRKAAGLKGIISLFLFLSDDVHRPSLLLIRPSSSSNHNRHFICRCIRKRKLVYILCIECLDHWIKIDCTRLRPSLRRFLTSGIGCPRFHFIDYGRRSGLRGLSIGRRGMDWYELAVAIAHLSFGRVGRGERAPDWECLV